MLSDEEKKAIEYLKIEYEKLMKEDNILFPLYKSDAKRLIDIIEKQSKEIDELKKYEKYYEEMEEVNKKFIAVDKIKAEIEELQEDIKYSANPLSIDNSKFAIIGDSFSGFNLTMVENGMSIIYATKLKDIMKIIEDVVFKLKNSNQVFLENAKKLYDEAEKE